MISNYPLIKLPFDVPEDYRRTFVFVDGDIRRKLEFVGREVFFEASGEYVDDATLFPRCSRTCEWIRETMMAVRQEFGQ